jgi:hypothetical protein
MCVLILLDTAMFMFNAHTTAADTLSTGTRLLLAPPAGMHLLLPVCTYRYAPATSTCY